MSKNNIFVLFLSALFLFSCSSQEDENKNLNDGFDVLIEYLESEADYVNSKETPFFISAPEVYSNLDNNYLVIDIRNQQDFDKGHIKNSVNITPNEIVDYLGNKIHPPSFEKIVIVCNAGYESAFIAMAARYLGYKNVFPIKNGLSSWNSIIAEEYRLKNISDSHSKKLLTQDYPKNKASHFPEIKTYYAEPFDILRERIINILNEDLNKYFISIDKVTENADNYYPISYWPEDRYKKGHLKGFIRYQPKQSLKSDKYLNTLPLDKATVIQCYMGNHSNFVAMYLNILGYDAKSLKYGANGFMYNIIKEEESAGKIFTLEKDVFNFPLEGTDFKKEIEFIIPDPGLQVQGGC